MSEKRFSVRLRSECDGAVYSFFDGDKPINVDMIVDKLNEQQSFISQLKELNDDKGKKIISLIRTNKTLKEENEQLRKELDNFKPVIFQDVRKGTVILYSKD